MVEFIRGKNFGQYVQSGENLSVTHLEDEVYEFKVIKWKKYPTVIAGYYDPIIVTPETDLSKISLKILEEFDIQMSYEGDSDDDWVRVAKISKTRDNIKSYLKHLY